MGNGKALLRLSFCLALAGGVGSTWAGEMAVEGRVVRVVPIHGQDTVVTMVGECDLTRPAAGAGLAAILAWDLQADCRAEQRAVSVVEGYRVYYEWDNRLFETVTMEEPADTIALRVRVR